MTRVCLVGDEGLQLSYELLSRETAREALAAYDLHEPYHNTVAVETVSLGAAVALLNDLDWYLSRFASEAMVLEPSVSETEWLSRELAAAIRNENVAPDAAAQNLRSRTPGQRWWERGGVTEPERRSGAECRGEPDKRER